MPMLPIDSSTVSTLAVVCAVLVFVFAFSSGMKPAAALLVAVVVGFVLKAIGFIPIGFMAIAICSLVVGIFKNFMGGNSNPPPQGGLPMAIKEQGSKEEHTPVLDNDVHDFLIQESGGMQLTNSTSTANPIHTEPKKPLPKTNTSLHFGFLIGLLVIVALVVYLLVKQNNENSSNYQPTRSTNSPTPISSPVAPTVTNTPQVPTTPISQANQEAMLMQKCDTFAVEHSRKSYTLTSQEHKEDYDKLYNSCLAEDSKPTDSSTPLIVRDYELLKAYQAIKIDNDHARYLLTEVWNMLPEQTKSADGFWLNDQRAWVKSKQKACGKVVQGKDVSALTNEQLVAEAVLLKCDTDANLERAKLVGRVSGDTSQTNNAQ
ncbi:hypothetical protein DTO96_100554 [Ephemeroptericola cinctiostellae]|uniref:Uncharacterized protein n=1 Tax=Ephemeroptericola cinctiostellae TaxID=2268024 RepID=A0A345D906_9BURK|nr:DUF1311 domain-containing protein [Ephemeroptericola cinctiostellae]AXF84844.1 hypothetical protein DTO96_100554 [Ephemeroptericola cinctiostellae]